VAQVWIAHLESMHIILSELVDFVEELVDFVAVFLQFAVKLNDVAHEASLLARKTSEVIGHHLLILHLNDQASIAFTAGARL